jgi:putative transposase
MAHHNTVFAQLLKFVSRHEFERLAKGHHCGQKLRSTSRWSQFVCLCLGQLSGRHSLRDIESNMKAQSSRLFHLGARPVARTSLSRLNQKQPYSLYEALFGTLYARCRGMAPKHGFRFNNKLYSLDASLIDLSLKIFPWAHYALGKAAMKLHVALDHQGYLPSFAAVTVGKTSDIEIGRMIQFSRGSIIVFDKGYTDYRWFKNLDNQGIFFVTRSRKNALWCVTTRQAITRSTGVTSDQDIVLTGIKPKKIGMPTLRRIGYRDPVTGKHYEFITNHFGLSAKTIADIYQQRWQIELFFKWIKQNLKIKAFIGNTKNAVLTQIWAALCVCLLLAYIKFVNKISCSLQSMLRLLQLNLFMRRDLLSLMNNKPPDEPYDSKQLCLL